MFRQIGEWVDDHAWEIALAVLIGGFIVSICVAAYRDHVLTAPDRARYEAEVAGCLYIYPGRRLCDGGRVCDDHTRRCVMAGPAASIIPLSQ